MSLFVEEFRYVKSSFRFCCWYVVIL